VEPLLREQWAALRYWLGLLDVDRYQSIESNLPGWTVGDLVAHLGYGLQLVADVRPAASDVQPQPLGDYIGQYRAAAPVIAQSTRELAVSMADVLCGIDALAEQAWTAIARLDHVPMVMARRGPIGYEDYLLTRLLEVVIYGDDLHRSLPHELPSPILDESLTVVAETLAKVYESRSGCRPELVDEAAWVRLAAGRTPSDDTLLPLL
jgi:uncharacterized protein (TIGR03083 family)